MSAPSIPPPLDQVGPKPFAFYPPILNFEQNEWLYRKANWSEVLVLNKHSGIEVWIPRHYIGEVSRVDAPIVIVGLRKELEFKAGSVWPHERRVIMMPRAVGDTGAVPLSPLPSGPAPVIGIRLESGAERHISRLIGVALIIGVLACVIGVGVFRGLAGGRVVYRAVPQSDLGLAADDDYAAVVRKLGSPAEDHWRTGNGALQYRSLRYPASGLTVILMGTDRESARYIGLMDSAWRPVHSVTMRGGPDSASLLTELPRF